ncbi:hypothetical protein SeMB42_g06082 [Synchytrium endobioticum]|uniref:Transmembrane protein 198 n=1 Tax=Synchytrium endobioticum TaxID=286115 RepID=A0A507CRY2_9FUNG|nr:hypothetical protein SeMB42_g06082 [Synchytrium endobioticum]TPX41932.1 hypothetical protein SeLEV6574_g05846 [Synchytrium endobioticum]
MGVWHRAAESAQLNNRPPRPTRTHEATEEACSSFQLEPHAFQLPHIHYAYLYTTTFAIYSVANTSTGISTMLPTITISRTSLLPPTNILLSILLFCIGLLNATPLPQYAQNPLDQAAGTTANVISDITAQGIVFGILLIVAGLILAFFGYRLFNLILFLAGAYAGGLIAYIILLNSEPNGGYANRDTIIIVVVLVVALISGLLTLCVWRIGLTILGGLMGLALGFFILSWVSGGTIQSQVGRIILLVVLSLLGSMLIHWITRPLIITSTAIIGAYSFIAGVDIFAQTGFSLAAQQFINDRNGLNLSSFAVGPRMYGTLAGFVVTALVGAVFQFAQTRTHTWNQPKGFVRYPHYGSHHNQAAAAQSPTAKSSFWR